MSNQPILDTIHRGVNEYVAANFDFTFKPGKPVVRLHECAYGAEEINAALGCLLSTYVTMGAKTREFEAACNQHFGFEHGIMVNSGSSANLLAVAALVNPALKRRFNPGDEVIVPALSWSTTVWPLIQCGLIPVIIDVDPDTLNLDLNEVRKAIGPKTRGVMPVHVYGNPCDMDALMAIAKEHDLIVIEDACEALGALYRGKSVGSFGDVGTFSFYYSHHITTLEGGICHTNNFELAELMRILRAHGWVRETQEREKYEAQYPHIDPRFLFVNVGFNLRPTELQSAFGPIQLKKLEKFIEIRADNAAFWRKAMAPWEKYFRFQTETPHSRHSWFGFPMAVREGAPFTAKELRAFLKEHNIENRPLIAGNIADQPALKLFPHRISGDLKESKLIMTHGFTWGNHHAVDHAARQYVLDTVAKFLKSRKLA
jgi:CDP-6-deoxy-D-xylo-4-hexulose-3-dehydrase